jgi:hypothetical protein
MFDLSELEILSGGNIDFDLFRKWVMAMKPSRRR